MPARKTLYLIDGHAQIFRAYFAIRGGMNSPVTGEPTQATFGYTGMLLKLFEKFKPHYVIVAMDTPGKNFRDELYPEYKATRKAPPDDFAPQLPRIDEVNRLFGIPVLKLDAAEADDVIATVTRRVLEDPALGDVDIRIVSRDKDLEQLLGERVTMFDIHTDTTIDTDALKQDKGITPAQVADVLALMGDAVDNIKGIDGIGPKNAARLVGEFGSIENILANIDKLPEKKRAAFEAARDRLALNLQLVRLKDDLELDFTLRDAEVAAIDAAALRRLFRELGFRRHSETLDRLMGVANPPEPQERAPSQPSPAARTGKPRDEAQGSLFGSLFDAGRAATAEGEPAAAAPELSNSKDCDYRAITTRAQLDELVATLKAQKSFSLDTETIGLGHRAELCGLSVSWEEGRGVYVPICSPDSASHLDRAAVVDALRGVLEDERIGKCGHNLKYDTLVLRHAGVTVRGVFFDSMVAAYLTGEPGLGLDDLALSLLRHEVTPIESLIGPRPVGPRARPQRTMDSVPLEQVTRYASEDADIALRLCTVLTRKLKTLGMTSLADDVEMPLVEVLAEMEHHGITVEPSVLVEQQQELGQRIVELRAAIHEAAGVEFSVDSPKQLAGVLFDRLKLPVIKRTKTGPSTDNEVLERLCDLEEGDPQKLRVPRLVVEYRQLTKLVSTYLQALRDCIDPRTGRVHATFHQTGTATGRLSSSGPNLQNIPIRTDIGRQVRRAFVAPPGHVLISADYSQIELRILAHLSRDKALCEAFERDMDIHTAVAAQVFNVAPEAVSKEQRGHAKVINFGIIYGVTAFGLARRIDGLDLDGAKALIAGYRARFSGIDTFLAQCVDYAQQFGFVTTMLGRRRDIPQIKNRNPMQRSLGERLAINTVVQGSAADLIKIAMVNLHRRILREKLPMKMLLQIHDELVLECPAEHAGAMSEVVRQEMEHAMKLCVPLKVEVGVGPNWLDAK